MLKIAVFYLGKYLLAIDALMIQEIINTPKTTHVLTTGDHIKGIVTFRGEVVAIVDMGKMLGITNVKGGITIVVRTPVLSTMGLLVDEVYEVLDVSPEDIKAIPTVMSRDKSYVKGAIMHKSELIPYFDLDALLSASEYGLEESMNQLVSVLSSTSSSARPNQTA